MTERPALTRPAPELDETAESVREYLQWVAEQCIAGSLGSEQARNANASARGVLAAIREHRAANELIEHQRLRDEAARDLAKIRRVVAELERRGIDVAAILAALQDDAIPDED